MNAPAVRPAEPADGGGVAVDSLARPIFRPGNGTVTWRGREARLRPQHVKVLELLIERRGHCCSKAMIAGRMYPAVLAPSSDTAAKVAILSIRRALAGMPVVVDTRPGFGWRLLGWIDVFPGYTS